MHIYRADSSRERIREFKAVVTTASVHGNKAHPTDLDVVAHLQALIAFSATGFLLSFFDMVKFQVYFVMV